MGQAALLGGRAADSASDTGNVPKIVEVRKGGKVIQPARKRQRLSAISCCLLGYGSGLCHDNRWRTG